MIRNTHPQTKAEFRDQLESLIRAAESNGVSIAGGYRFRIPTENADWGLELFEVTKPEE